MSRSFKKLSVAFAIVMVVLLLVVAGGLLWYRSASQPQIDGRLTLARAPGQPASTIDLVRDANAVLHVYARKIDDAHFALGFAHAQDRLWQLEMHRRIGAGRMAEVLGPDALDTDRFLRTLEVRRNAEAILPNLSPEARSALQSYADGINAYLKHRRGPLPPEFLIAGAAAPEPWEPADSIAWQTMMAYDLSGNWSQELMRMRLSQRLTLAQINEVLPPYPGDKVLPTQDYTVLYRRLGGTVAHLSRVAAASPPQQVEGMGSNNWVLSGQRTASGKPLMANDPHLSMTAPSLWYLAHLSAPGLNVIGASMPGLPGIVLGRNDRIAWGFTNTGPDVQDLYIERISPEDNTRYVTPDGSRPFSVRVETIKVKGGTDVQLAVRTTRHGPVISGALPVMDRTGLDARTHVISLAWTALRADDLTVQGVLGFNRAANWEQFLAAARDFKAPQQNVSYADIEGNIGFVAPGRIPVRGRDNDLIGLAPAPGWDARFDWQGFVPFEDLPMQFNPASQQIVTANQKIDSAAENVFLTSEWALPYRADRITALLQMREGHDIASFSAMQYDHKSLAALDLLPAALRTRPGSARASQALQMLSRWDGGADVARPEPLIFNAWMRELARRLLLAPLGPQLSRDYFDQRTVQPILLQVLKAQQGRSSWCGEGAATSTPVDCGALLTASLERALDTLEKRYGGTPDSWRWGEAHMARMEHRPFGQVAALAPLFDITHAVPGDAYTVNAGRSNLNDEQHPFASRHGAGYRGIYDLANPENSLFIQSTGQSGNRLSAQYDTYATPWAQGRLLPMQTRRAEVDRNRMGTLTIVR